MPSKKRNRSARKPAAETVDESVDLRTAKPVIRLKGQISILMKTLNDRRETLEGWTKPQVEGAEPNEQAVSALEALNEITNAYPAFVEAMDELEKSGFSPARKSYTATTGEGDRVAVLEDERHRYTDIMDEDLMLDMLVIKKQPGKGGGLIVEAKDGPKMKVALSHVVKLS